MTAHENRLDSLINTLILLRLDLDAYSCRIIQKVLFDIHTELSALHHELPQEHQGRTGFILRKTARLRFKALFSPVHKELGEFFEEAAERLQNIRATGGGPTDGFSK